MVEGLLEGYVFRCENLYYALKQIQYVCLLLSV